nr:DUF4040 domain-containing protein [Myxococcota bacterium]
TTEVPASAVGFHGFGKEVVLSLATLAAVALLFVVRAPLRRAGSWVAGTLRLRPAAGYEAAMRALATIAAIQTRVLQNGVLRTYLLVTVCAVVIAVALTLTSGPVLDLEGTLDDLTFRDTALGALVIAAAIVATRATSRFEAIAATGIVGFGVALIFLDLGAPDLAMTQFAVEALSVVVFVLAFYHLPHFARLSPTRTRVRDALVATVLGALVTVLVLAAASIVPEHPVSDWFLAESVPQGHGRNVVNVILTDFRSLDTLGEVVVLGTAAFGVLALLRLRLGRGHARDAAGDGKAP